MAHEVAHGDGFPEVGEADDFDIDAFVEAARAVDMAGIRAGVSQQEQGNEDWDLKQQPHQQTQQINNCINSFSKQCIHQQTLQNNTQLTLNLHSTRHFCQDVAVAGSDGNAGVASNGAELSIAKPPDAPFVGPQT